MFSLCMPSKMQTQPVSSLLKTKNMFVSVLGDNWSGKSDVNGIKENGCFLAILNWKVTKTQFFPQKHNGPQGIGLVQIFYSISENMYCTPCTTHKNSKTQFQKHKEPQYIGLVQSFYMFMNKLYQTILDLMSKFFLLTLDFVGWLSVQYTLHTLYNRHCTPCTMHSTHGTPCTIHTVHLAQYTLKSLYN